MKKEFLKFPARPVSYAPRIQSRAMRLQRFVNVAYASDGEGAEGGTDDSKEAEAKLLEKVKQSVAAEIESRGFKNSTDIAAIVAEGLKKAGVEALRDFDPKTLKDNVLQLANKVQQMQNRTFTGSDKPLNALKVLLEDEENIKVMERAWNKQAKPTVVLNTRAAVAVMTTDNVITGDNAAEFAVESFRVEAFAGKRKPNEFVFELADRRTMQEVPERIQWMEEGNLEGDFAIVAEGAVKPLVSGTLIWNTSDYKKVAGKRVYTEEFAKFRKNAFRILEQLFNDKLMRDYADKVMAALDTQAATYVGTSLDGQYENPTDYHAIGAVSAQEETLNFNPDVLIINPQDKWRISLQQNTNGDFFIAIPTYDPNGNLRIMGFRVVSSNKVPVGYAYLGEAGLFKVEDEPVTIRLGYGINVTKDVNGNVTDVDSDIDTNRFRIIAETFFHAYIASNNIGSFVKFSFAAVKTALLKVAP